MADSPRKTKKEKGKKKSGKTPRKTDEPSTSTSSSTSTSTSTPELQIPEGPAHKLFVEVKDCPVEGVTVYNDRAEVTRKVTAHVNQGSNELSVIGLSSKVDRNSVRMSGGKGSAVILEVQYNQRWEDKKNDESEVGRLKREKEDLEEQIQRGNEALGRIEKENQWLENWASTLSQPKRVVDKDESTEAAFLSSKALEQASNFMEFYTKKLSEIDDRRVVVNKSLKELREQLTRTNKQLGALTTGDRELVHEVVVLLVAQADSDVELFLSYVVMDAMWHAAYDVRVQSGKDQLDLTYYGTIVNDSLDDWKDAHLSLSTAKPAVGGAPPQLTTKFIGFQSAHAYPAMTRSSSYGHRAQFTNMMVMQAEVSAPQSAWAAVADDEMEKESKKQDEQLQVMTTAVKESSICTSFSIPRRTTILSDKKPHKVTVRMLQLEAKFTYVVIPKLSLHAYLKASIKNTSDNYPLLPGEINVFMDGNFVAKSSVKSVSPQESFSLFLGTDDAIKVTYPPGVWHKDTQGLWRKNNFKTLKHMTTIKNTKSTDVTVIVFDQLPKPNDAQIKVKLLRPTLDDDEEVILTEANNLKWKREISAGKEVKLPFEYSIEWPSGQELTGH